MNDLHLFKNEQFGSVRLYVDADGAAWFCGKDIAAGLDYPESSLSQINNLMGTVPAEWKGHRILMTPGGLQDMLCLTEQGVYFFLFRSDKPRALPYQKWLAGEVLPSIRKHGGYLTPAKIEEALLNPDTLIRLATDLKAERARREELEIKVEADRPKTIFADAVDASKTSILVGELATVLRQNGVNIGQNRLFALLREDGWLNKQGDRYNLPTQKAVDSGLMQIKERTVANPDGSIRITRTPKITGKGQCYFVNKFLNRASA